MATAMAACCISADRNVRRKPVASGPQAAPKSRQACMRARGPMASSGIDTLTVARRFGW